MLSDLRLTEKPEVRGSVPGPAHTFMEIDHEIFSAVIFPPSNDSRTTVVSYLQKYGDLVPANYLGGLSLLRNSVIRLTECPDMVIAVYHGCKAITTHTYNTYCVPYFFNYKTEVFPSKTIPKI